MVRAPQATRARGALPQLVAIDDCARNARHIVEDAALDKGVCARVTEQDQRRTIIITARVARDLPSLREQLVDRQRCLRWTPPASLPSRGLNACETLKPLVAFFKGATVTAGRGDSQRAAGGGAGYREATGG